MKKLLLIVLAALFLAAPAYAGDRAKESSFERIMRTNTIRCGYIVYPPGFMKDVNTGKYSGIIYELMEKVGQKLDLKIEWAEEVNWGNMFEGLKTGRYDMLCVEGWNITMNAKHVRQTLPLFYSAINAFVREGDMRFDGNLAAINKENIKISSVDGTLPSIIARESFSKAQNLDMPQNTDYSTIMLNVATGKADVTFAENAIAFQFMEKNPGKIRMVKLEKPIQYYANSMLVPIADVELQSMLDTVLGELLGGGFIDQLVARYDTTPPSFLPVAKPFATTK